MVINPNKIEYFLETDEWFSNNDIEVRRSHDHRIGIVNWKSANLRVIGGLEFCASIEKTEFNLQKIKELCAIEVMRSSAPLNFVGWIEDIRRIGFGDGQEKIQHQIKQALGLK